MRFRLKLVRAVENPIPISIDYRRRFISLLKRIFDKDFDEESPKPYTFAVYFGKGARIEGGYIKGVENINFRFSTGDQQVGIDFYNGAMKLMKSSYLHNMNPKLEDAYFRLTKIEIEKEIPTTGIFKTLSPVIVERSNNSRDPRERYCTPKDEDFNVWLLENTLRRYRAINMDKLPLKRFELEPLGIKEEFIKHYGGYVRGFLGTFRVHTDNTELFDFVYKYGMGVRTGQGFGFLEVLA